MEIQRNTYAPAFGVKFNDNKAFREVVQYAQENNCTNTLACALQSLKYVKGNPAKGNTISIAHGRTQDGRIYSTFIYGKRSVSAVIDDAKSATEATLNGLFELSMRGKKLKSLLGVSKIEDAITPENFVKEFTA